MYVAVVFTSSLKQTVQSDSLSGGFCTVGTRTLQRCRSDWGNTLGRGSGWSLFIESHRLFVPLCWIVTARLGWGWVHGNTWVRERGWPALYCYDTRYLGTMCHFFSYDKKKLLSFSFLSLYTFCFSVNTEQQPDDFAASALSLGSPLK